MKPIVNVNKFNIIRAFWICPYLKQPPICPSDILPPKGAGRDCGAMTSLAPFGGKGLRVRGLKVKDSLLYDFCKSLIINNFKKLSLNTVLPIIGLCSTISLISYCVEAQEMPLLEEVVSKAEGSARFLESTATSATVFTSQDIKELQAGSIQEILESLTSIHLTERGTPGSQADISIRGSSNEGVLLLINGIPVRDPQTGHFTLDIPLDISQIDRVEILSGGGSTLYGSSASGGIINIVTSDTGGETGGLSFGSFNTVNAGGSISWGTEEKRVKSDLRLKRSGGYRKGTDLKSASITLSGTLKKAGWDIRWNGGVLDKKFGAKDFYGPYPSYEKVRTFQGGLRAHRIFSEGSMIRLQAGGRGHNDDFILIRENPAFYRNTHYNRSFTLGGEYIKKYKNDHSLLMGLETGTAGITSGSLGSHSNSGQALYSEFSGKIGRMNSSVSLRYDRGYRGERVFSPGLELVASFGDGFSGRFRLERSFRSPTYTELYYKDPANSGNRDLLSEKSISIETGINRISERCETGISYFARQTTKAIDWARNPGEKVWQVVNHGSLLTTGIDGKINSGLIGKWKCLSNFTLLHQKVQNRMGKESKYVLNPAVTSVSLTLCGPLAGGMTCALAARCENLLEGGSRAPVSLRVSRDFSKMKVNFSANNITNEHYEEIPDLPAPGRWYKLEAEYIR
jgi:vitamin B12 transporter